MLRFRCLTFVIER